MENGGAGSKAKPRFWKLRSFLRKRLFSVVSIGPIPEHIAFIMDGNRRFAKKLNLVEGEGHNCGFTALLYMLIYCFELGVKYVTVYAFSIDNFRRKPQLVEYLMDMMEEKMEELMKEESIMKQFGVRIHFAGDLNLLRDSVKATAERVMAASAHNTKAVLTICVGYTSTNEIMHAIQEACQEKVNDVKEVIKANGNCNGILNGFVEHKTDGENKNVIKLADIEKHMYMAVAPDPDILVRTSGETRLSNFLLWQSTYTQLYSPTALWPEIGVWHLVWAVLNFQRNYSYLEKKKKQF